MSNERNSQSGKPESNLPFAGDAARKAEREGEAVNEAHGIRVTPAGEYRGLRTTMRSTAGARLVQAEPEKDWSARKASDYLPPQLKAELVAAGKLTEDGRLVASPPACSEEPSTPAPPDAANLDQPKSPGLWASLAGFFQRLFQ